MSDPSSLVELIRADPETGTARLIADYRVRLQALARSLGCDAASAEDLSFRTIERAVEKIDGCREAEKFECWLFAILVNYHRKDHRTLAAKRTVVSDELPEQTDERAERTIVAGLEAESLHAAIGRLSKEMREAIVMRYFLDIPVARMAKILALPEGTVKSRLHYARLCLSAILETRGGKAAFRLLVVALLFGAAFFGYRATRPKVPTEWMAGELARIAEGRRLGSVDGVSAQVYGRADVTVSRRLVPPAENDGAVLMAPCVFEERGVRVRATIQLLQIGDDIWGHVVDPETNGRIARLVPRLPSEEGELSVGDLSLSFRENAPEEMLRASFASFASSRRKRP